jgi:predicted glutamine amidotransferase
VPTMLGMNCNVPTDICFSFAGFQARGGATDVHSDGWGIAFFEGRGTRVFLEPQPSCSSPLAGVVRSYPIHSENVIAHIRKATQGVVALENTHPFMRELWGRYWIFAHNGHLPDFSPQLDGSFHAGWRHRQRARLLLAATESAAALWQSCAEPGAAFRGPASADSRAWLRKGRATSCCRTATACSRTAPHS